MTDLQIIEKLRSGCVIPAHPLALRPDKGLDERRQRALTRYYLAAGAGGLAVGVHTTQFAIHDPKVGLYHPTLELAIETANQSNTDPVMIAGIVGATDAALEEAQVARDLGYHVALLSLTAMRDKPIDQLIDHARQVADVIPIMGFYLQQTISQMVLPLEFWRKFVEIPNVVAIKIAPFNRYQTLDVLEAVAHSGRSGEIALYTGNDDNMIMDLLTPYEFNVNGRAVSIRIVGGLLGQWACWTRKAVELLDRIKIIRQAIAPMVASFPALVVEKILARIKRIRLPGAPIPAKLLTLAAQMTLANKAIFDGDSQFAGCIAGISYVLKQQGLLEHIVTLDPNDQLSPGQPERINQIIRDYPHLTDNDFVRENLDKWLS